MRSDAAQLRGRRLPANGCESCVIRIEIDHCQPDRCIENDHGNRQRLTIQPAAVLIDLVNGSASSVNTTIALLTCSNSSYLRADMGWPSRSPHSPKRATPSSRGVHVLACDGVETARATHCLSASLAPLAADREATPGRRSGGSFEECSLHFGLSPGSCHQPDRRCVSSAWQPHLDSPFHFQRHVRPALLRHRTHVRSRTNKRRLPFRSHGNLARVYILPSSPIDRSHLCTQQYHLTNTKPDYNYTSCQHEDTLPLHSTQLALAAPLPGSVPVA